MEGTVSSSEDRLLRWRIATPPPLRPRLSLRATEYPGNTRVRSSIDSVSQVSLRHSTSSFSVSSRWLTSSRCLVRDRTFRWATLSCDAGAGALVRPADLVCQCDSRGGWDRHRRLSRSVPVSAGIRDRSVRLAARPNSTVSSATQPESATQRYHWVRRRADGGPAKLE